MSDKGKQPVEMGSAELVQEFSRAVTQGTLLQNFASKKSLSKAARWEHDLEAELLRRLDAKENNNE